MKYGLLFLTDSGKSPFKSSVEAPSLIGPRKSTRLPDQKKQGLHFPSEVTCIRLQYLQDSVLCIGLTTFTSTLQCSKYLLLWCISYGRLNKVRGQSHTNNFGNLLTRDVASVTENRTLIKFLNRCIGYFCFSTTVDSLFEVV